ncbi:MAG: hypothetical protein EBU90_14600 [Proteobacteria bacterium]|nr:hypothetical protein [Pseudomonadota bacterium]
MKSTNKVKHGWYIDRDYISVDLKDMGKKSVSVTVVGPRETPFNEEEIKNNGIKFELYDDDDVLYYSGYVLVDPENQETITSPLEDYGMPGAGAVYMKIFENGSWKIV